MITMKFRNVFFSVTHRGKAKGRHRLTGLTSTDAITTEFRDQHGNSIRVVDYFATTYVGWILANSPRVFADCKARC